MSITPIPGNPAILVAVALAGSDTVLGHLLIVHQPTAYRVAYRLVGREAEAQEVVQDGFLHAVRAIRSGSAPPSEPARFKAWLLRVVANAALTHLRRRTKPGLRVADKGVVEAVPAPEGTEPAREAERRETRRAVLCAVMALPPAQRQALTLREYQGLSYTEIGEALGISRGAAEMLVFRARGNFRTAYASDSLPIEPPGCARLAPLLSRMLDDEVSIGTWEAMMAHLKGCAHCRAELKALGKTRHLPVLVPA